jgi:hypothetical protein
MKVTDNQMAVVRAAIEIAQLHSAKVRRTKEYAFGIDSGVAPL